MARMQSNLGITLKASETKLQKLIEGTNQYLIPLFQRSYTWTSREWEQLWTDIFELTESKTGEHFIGPIVTAPARSVPEGVAKYLLIDGQQRITTLFILLAALRDQANALKLETLGPEIDATLLKNPFKQGTDRFKLLPTQGDRKSFMDLIENSTVTGDDGISKCYRFFTKKFKKLEALALEQCKSVVVSRLTLVSIILDDADNPHVIFESLNSKGQDLTQADLIRNYFLMRVDASQQDRLFTTYWAPIQDRLRENTTEFIRHFLMMRGNWVRKDEVYWCLKGEADQHKTQDQIEHYLSMLERYSSYYQSLIEPEKAERVPGLRVRFSRLNRIEVTVAYPLLLALYHNFAVQQLSLEAFEDILGMLENFMLRRWVCNVPTSGLARFFPSVFGAAKVDGDLASGVRRVLGAARYPRDAFFREELMRAPLYATDKSGAKLKLVLERLEESFGHKETVAFETLTIEHILPQQITNEWRAMLGDDADDVHENLLHTLGNVTLTAYNSELSNSGFSTKKPLLIDSHLELNRSLVPVELWNRASIENRAGTLADRALAIWPSLLTDQSLALRGNSDVTGRKPVYLNVKGTRIRVDSWTAVLSAFLETLLKTDDDLPEFLLETIPRYFKADLKGLRRGLQLKPGVFYETHGSAMALHELCKRIARERGLSDMDWRVEVA